MAIKRKTSPQELTARLRQIEESWPPPTPEVEARCVRVLARNEALDLLGLLGLGDYEQVVAAPGALVKVPAEAKELVLS